MKVSIFGVIFLLLAISTAAVGALFLLPIASVLFYFPARPLYLRATCAVSSTWFALIALYLEVFFGMAIHSNIEEVLSQVPPSANVVVVSNHRTRIDWMILWCLFAHTPSLLSNLKIVLKEPLRRIPMFGWAMQHFRFLFLRRDAAVDEKTIQSVCKRYTTEPVPYTVLLFPEGTDLSESNQKKSAEFAAKNKLPEYRNVLLPRSTGLFLIAREIGPHVGVLLDVTMGYVDRGSRPSEASLLSGAMPSAVHFHVKAVNETSITQLHMAEGTATWTERAFAAKEGSLEGFYHRDPMNFSPPLPQVAIPMQKCLAGVVFWAAASWAMWTAMTAVVPWWGSALWVGGCIVMYVR